MSSFAIYRRLFALSRPYWLHLLGYAALALTATPLTLLGPLPIKIVVDSVIGNDPIPGFLRPLVPSAVENSAHAILLFAVGLLVAVRVLSQMFAIVRSLLHTYLGERLVIAFRGELFRHTQRLSLSYHDMVGSSDSLYRMQYDAMAIQYIVIDGIMPFVVAVTTIGSVLFVALRIDATLSLIALAVTPLLGLILAYFGPRIREQSRAVKKLDSSTMGVIQEALGAVRVVKAFGQEQREHRRFTHQSAASLKARMRLNLASGFLSLGTSFLITLGTAVVLYIGANHVREGALSLGNLLLLMGYVGALYRPVKSTTGRAGRLQTHLASAERAFALLDQGPDVAERPDAIPIHRSRGSVRFDNVSFAYDPVTPVLQGMTLNVEPGTCVGLVGRTGAGKTTIANLLLRFYDPTSGRIQLDGTDLRDYKLEDLRNQFSIVLQETVLFPTTIAENISYARPGASREEIIAAARAANIHDFIESLPGGYNTVVGERGFRLSGGERQRVSIARAFLKAAPLLILDEPTSSLDVATESGVVDAMRKLMQGRTTFLITHRASTLEYADVVVVLEKGRVSELRQLRSMTPSIQPAPVVSGVV